MVDDANVTNDVPGPQPSAPQADSAKGESQPEPQRVWSMPKPAVTRKQADEVGRIAREACTAVIRFIADVARSVGRALRQLSGAIAAVPPAVRLAAAVGVIMLLGIVGAIALPSSLGVACIVVVVPVCSFALGALAHRWYSGLGVEPAARVEGPSATAPELQRSVEYVDKKLAVALNAFGAERQQHAMIALFQAKTAVELTLGTEQDEASHIDALLAVDGHDTRPRIRAGSAPKSLRESNSLAAS
ncbi:hypothetical protein H5U98_13720 [Mycolicibacterium boenickei]|uniref:Uncharacterized protein n=1 Tax=Mycolicibacterium boenickei TaxID=146017 RepID=A0AAX3A494_9MYCO|nr:hypothetical protein CQY21_12980 [Mycolicibacterium boenickei]UNC02334.1 hypothetical protein H5U98_13720 [Mycolicibacterium boenickei]